MLKLEAVALTDVGRKRSNNQDYLGDLIIKSGRKYGQEKLNERGYLFAVADGMGGYAGGEVASELAITTLFEQFYNGPSKGDVAADLSNAIQQANFNVRETSVTSQRPQMGTTLTLVLVKGNRAIFGNVGDSRTYMLRQGNLNRVTHDHSLVQEQIDIGVLTPEQAERSSIKNFITRAIGHKEEVEEDLFERELMPGDILLLCSDGLHGPVKEPEMAQILISIPNLKEAAQKMINLANERGGPDNISVMLVRIDELGDPLPQILNGRGADQERIYSQPTEQIMAMMPPDMPPPPPPTGPITNPNQTTVRSAVPLAAVNHSPELETQATTPMTVAPAPRKPGGGGLIIGLLLLLVIAVTAVIAVVVFGGGTSSPAPTATPAPVATPTATVTNGPAATPPPALPTATPLSSPAIGPTVVAAAALPPRANPTVPPQTTGTSGQNAPNKLAEPAGAGAQISATPQQALAEGLSDPPRMVEEPFSGDPSQVRQVVVLLSEFDGSYQYRVRLLNNASFTTLTSKTEQVDVSVGLNSNTDYRIELLKQRPNEATPIHIEYAFRFSPGKALHNDNMEVRQEGTTLFITLKL